MNGRAHVVAGLGLVLALATCACSPEPSPTALPVGHDLLKRQATALVRSDTTRIDLGTLESLAHGLQGFSRPVQRGAEGSRVWGVGRRSRLTFEAATPGSRRVVFRGTPIPLESGEEQGVTPELNGTRLDRCAFPPEATNLAFELPGDALVEGTNELVLHYDQHRVPRDTVPGSNFARPAAALWDDVVFGLSDEAPALPEVDASGFALTVPRGVRIDHFVHFGPEVRLSFLELEPSPGATALLVRLEPAHPGRPDRPGLVQRLEPGSYRSVSWSLPQPGPIRLSLWIEGDAPGAAMRLVDPSLTTDEIDPSEGITQRDYLAPEAPEPTPGAQRPDVVLFLGASLFLRRGVVQPR